MQKLADLVDVVSDKVIDVDGEHGGVQAHVLTRELLDGSSDIHIDFHVNAVRQNPLVE